MLLPLLMNLGMFNPAADEPTAVGGKGDNRGIFKPTGFLDRPRKPESNPVIEQRLDDQAEIQAEIAGQLAREFAEESEVIRQREVALMTAQEIEREIGILIRKRFKNEEDEILLLLLLVAAHEC